MTPRNRWVWSSVAILAAGVVCVIGCGGTADPPAQQAPAAAAAQPAASQPAGGPATDAAATAAPAVTPAPAAAAADAMVQDHETGAEVTLVECKRTGGDSVTVKWRYRNATASPIKVASGGSGWRDTYQLTADTFFIDPVNKKKYLVITDDQRYPLASKHGDWQGVTLAPGQVLSAWAKLPAPPPDVQAITVTIPGVAPFETVPVLK